MTAEEPETYTGMHTRTCFTLVLALAMIAQAHTFREDNARTGMSEGSIRLPLVREHSAQIGAPFLSSPILVGDTVYIGARDSCVYAFHDGIPLWRRRTGGWVDASPTYSGGRLYIASRDGWVRMLSPATGDSLGAFLNANTQCSTPLVHDSLLVFGRGGTNREIKAFNTNTGRYLWHAMNSQPVYSSPAQADSVVCYADNSGMLKAVHYLTGSELWACQTGGGTYLSTPAISEGRVYFSPGDYDPSVYCFALAGGFELWRAVSSSEALAKPLERDVITRFLSVSGPGKERMLKRHRAHNRLTAGQVRALRALASGNVTAEAFPAVGGVATSSVAVDDERAYVIRMEYGPNIHRFALTAFDKYTGEQQWTFAEARQCQLLGFCSSPIVVDSLVFFGWGEGKVYAVHAETGEKLWEDSLGGDILSSPAAGNGKVYVATTAGQLVTYTQGPSDSSFTSGTFCYPNPARGGQSSIRVSLLTPGTVAMTISTMADKPVLRYRKHLGAGRHPHFYDWDLDGVANGVYLARITVTYDDGGEDKKTVKIAVLK
ncbi:MAG: PQQ-binding-like beta-propeller repeat protein [Chitinivibrionales bacterium]|nr:PQQ-binding-like beta-propeller repeat protein [Chitinivibrionales bacterium]MBD3396217.1 PQQ-binding-like beta-propeller repeat protein [Chitinivibrionales bacterium]